MALIECPDCKKQISDLAPSCINCGRPMRMIETCSSANPNGPSDILLEAYQFEKAKIVAQHIIEIEDTARPVIQALTIGEWFFRFIYYPVILFLSKRNFVVRFILIVVSGVFLAIVIDKLAPNFKDLPKDFMLAYILFMNIGVHYLINRHATSNESSISSQQGLEGKNFEVGEKLNSSFQITDFEDLPPNIIAIINSHPLSSSHFIICNSQTPENYRKYISRLSKQLEKGERAVLFFWGDSDNYMVLGTESIVIQKWLKNIRLVLSEADIQYRHTQGYIFDGFDLMSNGNAIFSFSHAICADDYPIFFEIVDAIKALSKSSKKVAVGTGVE